MAKRNPPLTSPVARRPRRTKHLTTSKAPRAFKGLRLVGILMALITASVGVASFLIQLDRANRKQLQERQNARFQAEELIDEAWDLMGGKGGSITVSEESFDLERFNLAGRKIKQALELAPATPPTDFVAGTWYLFSGKAKLALPMLESAARGRPKESEYWMTLGAAYARLGATARARAALKKAISLDEHSSKAWNLLGSNAWNSGQPGVAVRHFQRAVEADSAYFPSLSNLSTAYLSLGHPERALRLWQDYIAQHSAHLPNAYIEQGIAQRHCGLALAAEESFRRAFALRPTSLVLNNLGNTLADQGLADEAREAYRKALDLDASNHHALYNLGVLLLEQGELIDALTIFDKLLSVGFPNEERALRHAAQVLLGFGPSDAELAESYVRSAILLEPNHGYNYAVLGISLRLQGKQAEAQLAFAKAKELLETEGLDLEIVKPYELEVWSPLEVQRKISLVD